MLAKHLYHRRTEALKIRTEAAQISTLSEYPSHISNGEEQDYSNTGGPSYIANYSKGLPHNAFGEVNRRAYRAMVRALHSRDPETSASSTTAPALEPTRVLTIPGPRLYP
jgi:hypothetical protein